MHVQENRYMYLFVGFFFYTNGSYKHTLYTLLAFFT